VAATEARILAIERPSPRLLAYYALASLVAGPGYPILFALRFLRYRTLRYRFDAEGISMAWGGLFRREIHLTYSRIQDIHLTSTMLERYLGLARIQIQTASGKTGAEMTIVGLEEHEQLRDFIYGRMRGLRRAEAAAAGEKGGEPAGDDRIVAALAEVAAVLGELRELLADEGGRPARPNG